MMTRAEHLQWTKDRALHYVEAGDLSNAYTSLFSDLRKHPELENHLAIQLGMMELIGGNLTAHQARQFIKGVN